MTTSAAPYDVAVVGLGPTGATLANLLAICGLTVVVLERETSQYHLPRAVHFDDETMRVFQTVGIAGALAPKLLVNPGMRFVDPDGTMLLDWPRPQQIGPQGWYPSYRFHQPDLESLLRRRLGAFETVTILSETEVTGVSQLPDHVLLQTRSRTTDAPCQIKARYVVGCDGARSTLRQDIGDRLADLGFQERWLVVDAILKHDMPELGNHTMQICDPDRPMTYCRSPGLRRRWEISLKEGETDADATNPNRVWQFLSRWITPKDADLERAVVYTFRSAVARTWRSGRLMIAGDAAHLTPPFMGQGLCAGIRDAANLAWKLALVVKGRAGDALLDSYQVERDPNVRAYITTAMRLGGLINSLDRDGALALAQDGDQGRARLASIAPRLGDPVTGMAPDPARGQLFGQPRLSKGTLLDDAVGFAPALLLRSPLPMARANEINGRDHPEVTAHLDALVVDAVLLRPDRYVMASAQGDGKVSALRNSPLLSPLG